MLSCKTVPKNAAGRAHPEEGSVAPLIVGMVALLLIIGSVIVAVTGVYLQTQRLQDLADAQANSVTRMMEGMGERSESAAQARAEEYLSSLRMGRDLQNVRVQSVSLEGSRSVHVVLSARIRPPLLSVIVPEGIEVSAQGTSRLKDGQGPGTD